MASFFKQQTLSPGARSSVRSSGTNRDPVKSMISAPFVGSAYSRIFSTKNVATNILPSFMISDQSKKGITEQELQKFNIMNSMYSNPQDSLSKTQAIFEQAPDIRITPQPTMRASSSIGNRLRLSNEKIEEVKKIEKVQRDIFNPILPQSENVLSIRKRQLKREDLVNLKEGIDLSECLVDCYMSLLKQTNSSRLKYAPDTSKVLIGSATFSQMIFLKGREIAQPKSNIFKYDILLFPINMSYWTLLVVDMKRMTIKLYDPIKEHKTISIIMSRLTRFIQKAASKENSKVTYNFQFITHPAQNLGAADSGVYICSEAENIAVGKTNLLTKEKSDAYRKDMLLALVKASSS